MCRRWAYPRQGQGCWDVGGFLLFYPCLRSAHAIQLLPVLFSFVCLHTFAVHSGKPIPQCQTGSCEQRDGIICKVKQWNVELNGYRTLVNIGWRGLWVVPQAFPAVPHTKSPLWCVLPSQIQNRICCRRAGQHLGAVCVLPLDLFSVGTKLARHNQWWFS